jgi:hypothetical protein
MNAPLDLRALLLDPANNGVYYFDRNDREDLAEAAANAGLHVVPVDFADCAGKHDALARIAVALAFPEWFGGNWDALADALGDLSWLPEGGLLMLFDNARDWRERDEEDFAVLLDICGEAAQDWTRERRPFWAVIPLAAEQLTLVGREDESESDDE